MRTEKDVIRGERFVQIEQLDMRLTAGVDDGGEDLNARNVDGDDEWRGTRVRRGLGGRRKELRVGRNDETDDLEDERV